ncbi:MAG: hypothetical protein WBO73_19225 [Gammaproteobacteria bacterium]
MAPEISEGDAQTHGDLSSFNRANIIRVSGSVSEWLRDIQPAGIIDAG